MNKLHLHFVLIILLTGGSLMARTGGTRPRIDLSGEWTVKLDSTIITPTIHTVKLPGSLDENKVGTLNTEAITDCLTRRYIYIGKAVYERQISIPDSWSGQHIELSMERSKKTIVSVDGQVIGSQNSLSTPHVYDLSIYLKPGKHILSIEVDNNPSIYSKLIGSSHALSEDTQTNWNGILGNIYLESTGSLILRTVKLYPDIANKEVKVVCDIKNRTGKPQKILLTARASGWNSPSTELPDPVSKSVLVKADSVVSFIYPLGANARLWDEFNHELYKISVSVKTGDEVLDIVTADFGLRKFSSGGNKFAINGKKIFLRGKHEGGVFPLTGYPPMDTDGWLRVFKIAKAYGINHYRFHSWCPPEAAFEAADIAGMYLAPELPNWANFDTKNQAHNEFQIREGQAILDSYGNHPSFVMMTLGNEGGGDSVLMNQIVAGFRQKDNRHLFAQGSNNFFWNPVQQPGDDFWVTMRTGPEKDNNNTDTRGAFSFADSKGGGYINSRSASSDMTYTEAVKNTDIPVVGHEVGQFQSYPDFNETVKYKGVLEARNFKIFKERIEKAGMLNQAGDFAKASGALSVICYREEIEAALRTPGFGGFQLLDLQDYPGQGTALVGILDAFMDSKGFIAPENWRQFCSEVVPLAVFPKYTWLNTESFKASLKVANYGPVPLPRGKISYKLTGTNQTIIASGTLETADLPQGQLSDAGKVAISLKDVKEAQRLDFEISINGTDYKNSYPVWVYPDIDVPKADQGILIVKELNGQAKQYLAEGKKVLLIPDSSHIPANSLAGLFITDFWNYSMFKGISLRMKKEPSPGTLGILTNPSHPIFRYFPTEFHSNWQWWNIAKNSHPIILDTTDPKYRPIVQVIDNIDRNHKLGMVYEFKKGNGKLLVCSAELFRIMDKPEVRLFYKGLLEYMKSDQFEPAYELTD